MAIYNPKANTYSKVIRESEEPKDDEQKKLDSLYDFDFDDYTGEFKSLWNLDDKEELLESVQVLAEAVHTVFNEASLDAEMNKLVKDIKAGKSDEASIARLIRKSYKNLDEDDIVVTTDKWLELADTLILGGSFGAWVAGVASMMTLGPVIAIPLMATAIIGLITVAIRELYRRTNRKGRMASVINKFERYRDKAVKKKNEVDDEKAKAALQKYIDQLDKSIKELKAYGKDIDRRIAYGIQGVKQYESAEDDSNIDDEIINEASIFAEAAIPSDFGSFAQKIADDTDDAFSKDDLLRKNINKKWDKKTNKKTFRFMVELTEADERLYRVAKAKLDQVISKNKLQKLYDLKWYNKFFRRIYGNVFSDFSYIYGIIKDEYVYSVIFELKEAQVQTQGVRDNTDSIAAYYTSTTRKVPPTINVIIGCLKLTPKLKEKITDCRKNNITFKEAAVDDPSVEDEGTKSVPVEECSVFDRFLQGDFEDKRVVDPYSVEDFDNTAKSNMDLAADDMSQEKLMTNPEFTKIITEYMNYSDKDTRKALISMNEAEQSSVLTSLTSKLYDNIVSKASDIDFGEIPVSKGDISKLSNYDKIKETIKLLNDIVAEYKQSTGPVVVLSEAIANIETHKEQFEKCFRYDIEMGMLLYSTMTLSIMNGISYLIASCIEFIKSPKTDTFDIVLDKMQYAKSKDYLVYTNIDKFNKACKKGDIDKVLDHLIGKRVKNLTGTALAATITAWVIIVALAFCVIPLMRELIFFFFYTRTKISDFFDIQADLLQMNAYNVEQNDTKTDEERRKIAAKQIKTSDNFRKIANFFKIDSKKSEVEAAKELQNTKKKYTVRELESPELAGGTSSLF